MGREVIVPKQEAQVTFDVYHLRTVERYLKLSRRFDLQGLGIEMQPLSDVRWAFNKFLVVRKALWGIDYSMVKDPDYSWPNKVVLPEKAKLTLREDITVERLFANLNKNIGPSVVLTVPDSHEEYYLFRPMFSKVANKDNFKKQVTKMLDSLPVETLTYEFRDKTNNETATLEFVVQQYLGWIFVRLAALQYKDFRFEHVLKSLTAGVNVYSKQSEAVTTLKDYIVFRPTLTERMFEELIAKCLGPELNKGTLITFISEDLALKFSVRVTQVDHKERTLFARFTAEVDYTMFLE